MKIVFSVEKRRPGCILLQAAMGGSVPSEKFHRLFPSETWLVAPTADMGPYNVTEEQLKKLSTMALREVAK